MSFGYRFFTTSQVWSEWTFVFCVFKLGIWLQWMKGTNVSGLSISVCVRVRACTCAGSIIISPLWEGCVKSCVLHLPSAPCNCCWCIMMISHLPFLASINFTASVNFQQDDTQGRNAGYVCCVADVQCLWPLVALLDLESCHLNMSTLDFTPLSEAWMVSHFFHDMLPHTVSMVLDWHCINIC
jgi:hypothetical protein